MGEEEEVEEEQGGAEEEERRREVAIASTQSLQPNFNPIRAVTQDQLSKLRELHRRRLKIKSKTRSHKKSKDGTNESHGKGLNNQGCGDMDSSASIEESSVPKLTTNVNRHSSSEQKDGATLDIEPKKRKKLHWGLDTRERWERKANM